MEGSTTESLSTRLFKARLEMVAELDSRIDASPKAVEPVAPYGEQLSDAQLRGELAGLLHEDMAAMNLDNFVVRPQRQAVEKFAKLEAWNKLDVDSITELAQKVAGLPTALLDNDEEAKRFDMLVLRTQLSILQARPDFAVLRERLQAIAGALDEQDAIPAIKAHMALIQAIAGDEWWDDVTVAMLEAARKKLRALVKLIEKGKKVVVYTDFEDELGEGSTVELPGVGTGMNLYQSRVMKLPKPKAALPSCGSTKSGWCQGFA